MTWLAFAAWAGERDPLPALPVERPLAVPRGWSVFTVGTTPSEDVGASLRYGVLPRVELNVGAGLVVSGGEVDTLDTALGARLQVLRRDLTNTSVAVDLGWRSAFGAGISAARRFGPLLGTVAVGGWWRDRPVGAASATLLLQVGPLAPWVSVGWGSEDPVAGSLGLVVQLSRGLALRGAIGRERPTGAVEVAF